MSKDNIIFTFKGNTWRYFPESIFDQYSQKRHILASMPNLAEFQEKREVIRNSVVSPELLSLYHEPLLNKAQEQHLFRQMNYYKHQAYKLIQKYEKSNNPMLLVKIDKFFKEAGVVKQQIAACNTRLVMNLARKQPDCFYMKSRDLLLEIASDGNLALVWCIDFFDYRMGNRFSTYATWAIRRKFKECRDKRIKYLMHHCNDETVLFDQPERESVDLFEDCNKEIIKKMLLQLETRQRVILTKCYGLNGVEPETLRVIGEKLRISKERVRQIKKQCIERLKELV